MEITITNFLPEESLVIEAAEADATLKIMLPNNATQTIAILAGSGLNIKRLSDVKVPVSRFCPSGIEIRFSYERRIRS